MRLPPPPPGIPEPVVERVMRQMTPEVFAKATSGRYIARANPTGEIRMVPKGVTGKRAGPVRANVQPIPDSVVAAMKASLPPEVRRTARARLEALTQQLLGDFRAFRDVLLSNADKYAKAGEYAEARRLREAANREFIVPESLRSELQAVGWRVGDPALASQVEEVAKRLVLQASHKQEDKDQHRVTSDWHGHLDHKLVLSKEVAAPAVA